MTVNSTLEHFDSFTLDRALIGIGLPNNVLDYLYEEHSFQVCHFWDKLCAKRVMGFFFERLSEEPIDSNWNVLSIELFIKSA